jgi:nucleolar protein 4
MLASVIDGLLDSEEGEEGEHASADESEDGLEGGDVVVSSDDGASSGGEEEEDDEEEEGEEGEEETAAEGPAVAAADPFSRKQLLKNVEAAGAAAAAVMGQQRQRTEPEQNATVFVRGLPLDASKEQLFLKMKVRGEAMGRRPGWELNARAGSNSWRCCGGLRRTRSCHTHAALLVHGCRPLPRTQCTQKLRGAASQPWLALAPVLQAYGPVRSCRLVVDKASGKIKGTAFVDFYQRASAEAVAEACAKGR